MFIDYHDLLEYDDCYILRKELKEFLFKTSESKKSFVFTLCKK